ncbi:hypothetical protein MZK47_07250 [Microbacterium aerolatum]|uniref:hypothetical protein n=1 Tax=Microbacterium aerolatum TaxID=153731 RepID=UPI002001B3FB|nr:hypothetical protein [Microbacterium aerolatum]MCK3769460.1 hypothetical protein [Microbacterium aerolatum]
MVYAERNVWATLIVTVLMVPIYIVVTLQQAGGGPLTSVDWLPNMLWAIGLSIVAAIVLSILWGIAAGLRDPKGSTTSDIRDRDIERMGGRVEHSFLAIAGLGVIALCAVGADVFWIANAMFLGFAVSAFIGGVARVVAYRRGLV